MTRRTLTVVVVGMLLAGAAAISMRSAFAQGAITADLILSNGKIVTVDDRFTIAQAVAIKGNRIVAVGANQEMDRLAAPNARRINLRGRTVIPGLIDNHNHLLRAGTTWPLELRFDGVGTRKKAIEMIRARGKQVGPGQWVFNIGGWATAQFTDDPKPFTREELDQIAPDNPVALQESYYQVFLNSRGLKAFGIEPNAPDPSDFVKGSIMRDAAGTADGRDQRRHRGHASRCRETSEGASRSSRGQQSVPRQGYESSRPHDVRRRRMQRRRAGHLQDMEVAGSPRCARLLHRGAAAASPEQVDKSLQQIAQMKLYQGDEFIDDVVFGESVYTPLHDRMFATKSDPPPDQLAQWRRMAMGIAQAGLPLHVHAELKNTIDAFLDQIEAVNKQYPVKNLRWALAHVNQINASQLERMRRLGMYAAVHPWAVINGGIMHESFGDEAYDMPPLTTIQNSGVTWGLGTDATAANQYLPFTTLSFAVTGKMAGGARTVIRQTISREDALIAHTRKNAYFVFQEGNLGSIQPGKLADLVVLDRDYLTIPADQIKDISPVMTMVDGRVVFDAETGSSTR